MPQPYEMISFISRYKLLIIAAKWCKQSVKIQSNHKYQENGKLMSQERFYFKKIQKTNPQVDLLKTKQKFNA